MGCGDIPAWCRWVLVSLGLVGMGVIQRHRGCMGRADRGVNVDGGVVDQA